MVDQNTDINKVIDGQIKLLQKDIKQAQEDKDNYEKILNQESYKLAKKGIPTKDINTFVGFGKIAYSNTSSIEDIAKNNDYISQYLAKEKDYANLIEPLKSYIKQDNIIQYKTSEIAKLQSQKVLKAKVVKFEPEEVPDGTGHLYPIGAVVEFTNELNYWKCYLDNFLAKLDEISWDIDITWLCKKCEWVCRKVNFALARIRYHIVKMLHKMYEQVKAFLPIVTAIVTPPTSPDEVVSWAGDVIKPYTKPYSLSTQFLIDFTTKTPPLLEAAGGVISSAAQIPVKVLSRINLVADDGTGEKKELAEIYKKYFNIQVDPITLPEIISGNAKKPVIAEFTANAEQYKMLENKQYQMEASLETWYNEFIKQFETVDVLENNNPQYQYPGKINYIDQFTDTTGYQYYYNKSQQQTEDWLSTATIVYELAKEKEKLKEAKEKAIKKAEKAKKLAERNEQLAAKDILNDEAIKEAEQAKIDADKALKDANNLETIAPVPWGTSFNSNRYEIYPMVTAQRLKLGFSTGEWNDLIQQIIIYYQNVYGNKTNTKTIAKTVMFLSFLKNYNTIFKFIDEELDKLKNMVIEYDKISKEMSELNKKSIFK